MTVTDLLFVFGFLPVYVIIVFLCREGWEKNFAAAVMSLVFVIWARPIYYALVFLDVFVVYAAGRLKKRKNYAAVKAAAMAATVLSALPAAVGLFSQGTLTGSASAMGYLLFIARSFIYLREEDEEANVLNLMVYLVSFEFMSMSPLYSYSQMKERIASRRTGLAYLSSGFERYACGLAAVTVSGFSLERIWNAALHEGALPWMNALIGLAACAVGIYVFTIGYLSMSEGLCLMSGYKITMHSGAFLPKSLMLEHVGAISPTYSNFAGAYTSKARPLTLVILSAVFCLLAGMAIGLGAGLGALVCVIAMVVCIQALFETGKSFMSAVFTGLVLLVGFIAAACGSVSGISAWIGGLNASKYDFGMSYALFAELKRSVVWAVLGLIYVSPLRVIIRGRLREAMSGSETAYGAVRILGVFLTMAALVVSTVAMVSAQG